VVCITRLTWGSSEQGLPALAMAGAGQQCRHLHTALSQALVSLT
jgi:hypothetical protein